MAHGRARSRVGVFNDRGIFRMDEECRGQYCIELARMCGTLGTSGVYQRDVSRILGCLADIASGLCSTGDLGVVGRRNRLCGGGNVEFSSGVAESMGRVSRRWEAVRGLQFGDIKCDRAAIGLTRRRSVDEYSAGRAWSGASGEVKAYTVSGSASQVVAGGRGRHYERNKRKKENRRVTRAAAKVLDSGGDVEDSGEKKLIRGFGRGNCEQSRELYDSVEAKWRSRNELERRRHELAIAEVDRKLALLRAVDVEDEVKRERTKILAATERNMVSVEKSHALLAATGNVAGVFHGSAETVVSAIPGANAGSISPNSSASQSEVRAMQKMVLDQQKENDDLKTLLRNAGVDYESHVGFDKQTFTDNTEGNDMFDTLYPEGMGVHFVTRGGVRKFRIGVGDDY